MEASASHTERQGARTESADKATVRPEYSYFINIVISITDRA
jgi:hypothetical protein